VSPLSQREAEVLELVRTGHTTKDIAAQLGISTSTVLWHRKLALARKTAAATPSRIPSSRTTSTRRSTSVSDVRQLTIAGRRNTTPR
jgi:DNA-binding NarL/FixJ family response regulator